MASRVAGAVLALTAAALLAVSVVASAWWSGHPKFNGAEIKAKEINVGPLGATGCNTGGDGACMNVPVDTTFEMVGFMLAGITGLLAITALALSIFTARTQPRRKSFAVFVIVGSIVATLCAVALVAVGPKIRTEAPLPFASGLFVFFGGITAALASSVFAMRTPAAPRPMQLAPARQSRQSMQQMPVPISPHGGLDVHALLAEDALRPSSLGPEPRLGRGSPVHSPGGALPGPSGPLGAIGGSGPQQPLFSSAPQLRPLYDVAPGQGGTGGFVPQAPANMQFRPPTPIPRDQISAIAGIPTPASIDAQRPVTVAGVNAPPPPPPPPDLDVTDRDLLGAARIPRPLPSPNRNKPSSIPPQVSPLVQPRPLPSLANASMPPPPADPEEPFDSMQTYQREDSPPSGKPALEGWPPVEPPAKPPAKPAPTRAAQTKAASIAARVAAMPRTPPSAKPSVPMPAKPVVPAAPPPRPPTRLLTEDASIDTDISTQAVDDDAPSTETFETATNESTSFASKPKPPVPVDTADEDLMTVGREKVAPTDDEDDVMTVGREKVARTDVELPTVRPPTETSPSTDPAPEAVVEAAPAPAPPAAAAPLAEPEKPAATPEPPKLPLSTAPDSLPPPTEKQAAASGPSPACPQCEAPMAWVEAHLRFYCKSCKMYF